MECQFALAQGSLSLNRNNCILMIISITSTLQNCQAPALSMCDVDSNIDINNDASSSSTDTHKKHNRDELGTSEDWIDDIGVPTACARHVPCCNTQSLALPEPVVIQKNGEYNNT